MSSSSSRAYAALGHRARVAFSLTAHEEPDSVVDLIRNIHYFARREPHVVVVHASAALYGPIRDRIQGRAEFDRVYLTDPPFDKGWATYAILDGHLENYAYLTRRGVVTDFVITLASNCLLVRDFCLADFDRAAPPRVPRRAPFFRLPADDAVWIGPPDEASPATSVYAFGWWKIMFRNQRLMRLLSREGIDLYEEYHEGRVYEGRHLASVADFCRRHGLKALVDSSEFCAEEILLPSLYRHFSGWEARTMCERDGDFTVERIREARKVPWIYAVKRVSRNYNDSVRAWMRDSHAFYTLPGTAAAPAAANR